MFHFYLKINQERVNFEDDILSPNITAELPDCTNDIDEPLIDLSSDYDLPDENNELSPSIRIHRIKPKVRKTVVLNFFVFFVTIIPVCNE